MDPGARLTLGRPAVTRSAGALEVRCPLEPDRELRLVLTGDDALVARATPSVEVFLPIAWFIAALEGRELRVAGPVDRAYVAALRAGLPAILRLAYDVEAPALQLVDAAAGGWGDRVLVRPPGRPAPDAVALPFSAGVDSFHSLLQLERLGLSLGCLVNVNAGGHGRDRRIFRARLARMESVAGELGVPLLAIDTNLHEVLPYGHARTYSLRTLPVLGLLRGVVGAAIYSSSLAYPQVDLGHLSESLAYAGPVVAAILAWSRLPVIAVGHDVTRTEKSRAIAASALAVRHLDVCVDGAYQRAADPDLPINCGECSKCTWTMITLDHLGVLDRFAAVFPTERYRAGRAAWLARLYQRRDPDLQESPVVVEIRQLVERTGGRPPDVLGTAP